VAAHLVSGVASDGFTDKIQTSGEFAFAKAEVSQPSEDYARYVGIGDGGEDGPSTATVVVATLISVSAVAFMLVSFVYHKRSGRWVPKLKLQAQRDAQIDLDGPSVGPASLLSYAESSTVTATNSQPGLLRLLSLSTSHSQDSTSPDDSDSRSSNEIKMAPNLIVSPMSEDAFEEEHPLANIIPPMIVIDNIDDDTENESNHYGKEKQQRRQMVPSKRVDASSAFLSALNESRKTYTSRSIAGMI
jgi:hypothetical protein